jgi:hypothetical protein
MQKPQIYIGIDPGQRNGFAVWDSLEQEFKRIKTFKFHQVLKELYFYHQNFNCEVVLEATYLNKPVWHTSANKGKAARMARNVGMNQQTARLIADYCKEEGIPLIESKPGRNSHTKLTQEAFELITGCKIKVSQHARDASLLVFKK